MLSDERERQILFDVPKCSMATLHCIFTSLRNEVGDYKIKRWLENLD